MTTLLKQMETAILDDTYELHVFFHRVQSDGESFDQFLMALKELAKYCDMCDCMKERLLKGKIITGIPDATTFFQRRKRGSVCFALSCSISSSFSYLLLK